MPGVGYSLRFHGAGGLDDDRVKIQLDVVGTIEPGPPVDVGGDDFTIEWWMRAGADDNPNPDIECGPNINWVTSNIIIDRDRHSQPRAFGAGVAGGVIVFSTTGEFDDAYTICGTSDVLDDAWHHVAIQRRRGDGFMWLYVDGRLEASVDGPDGDISYPDDGIPMDICPGGACDYSDPYLVFGAEKHGYTGISYNGYLDEVRVSDSLRYSGDTAPVPPGPFAPDGSTVGLYHFDEGEGDVIGDSSAHPDGTTDGVRHYGGEPPGPDFTTEIPF